MGTTTAEIKRWFDQGKKEGAAYMIVVCDTFDHGDYPVYVMPDQDYWEEDKKYNHTNMQRIMEVYDFKLSWKEQSGKRVHNTPPREQQVSFVPVKPKKVKKQPSKKDPKIGQRKVKYDT